MDMVCEHLNLLEKDYFGLTFADADTQKVSELCATITSWDYSVHKRVAPRPICIPLTCGLGCLCQGCIIHHSKMNHKLKFPCSVWVWKTGKKNVQLEKR